MTLLEKDDQNDNIAGVNTGGSNEINGVNAVNSGQMNAAAISTASDSIGKGLHGKAA